MSDTTGAPERRATITLNIDDENRLQHMPLGQYAADFFVFIGRLQPPTKAHIGIVRMGLANGRRMIVLLGSANRPRSPRNPFTFEERERMLRACLSDEENERVIVVPLDDSMYNDSAWTMRVQELVYNAVLENLDALPGNGNGVRLHGVNDARVWLIGCQKDHTSYYLNLFPRWGNMAFDEIPGLCATDVRRSWMHSKWDGAQGVAEKVEAPIHSILRIFRDEKDEFRALQNEAGALRQYRKLWENAPFPVQFLTADAVVIQSGHIAMIRRGEQPGKGLWALPGGFVGERESMVQAALRELKEETRIDVPMKVLEGSIKDRRLFDEPLRSERGRTVTQAILISLPDGPLPKLRGSSDAEAAEWMPLGTLDPRTVFEDHYDIIQSMVGLG